MLLPFDVSGFGMDAVGTGAGFSIRFSGKGIAAMFLRRAVRLGTGNSDMNMPVTLLVAELNGVRSYIRRKNNGEIEVLMSCDDVYP